MTGHMKYTIMHVLGNLIVPASVHWEVGIDPQLDAYGGRKKKREGLFAASLHTVTPQCRHKSWMGRRKR